ncbi:MAG TPA: STAS domain-containing protein [Actinomycetota bacterium]
MEGELDLTNADEFSELVEGELRAGREVVLDLSQLTFMDSSGLRALIRVAKAGREFSAPPLVLESVSPAVQQLLSIALPSGIPGVQIR